MGEGVGGEGVAADHDEVADEPESEGDEGPADERVAHETGASTSIQFDW